MGKKTKKKKQKNRIKEKIKKETEKETEQLMQVYKEIFESQVNPKKKSKNASKEEINKTHFGVIKFSDEKVEKSNQETKPKLSEIKNIFITNNGSQKIVFLSKEINSWIKENKKIRVSSKVKGSEKLVKLIEKLKQDKQYKIESDICLSNNLETEIAFIIHSS